MTPNEPVVYRDRFERKEKLGSGSYGSVYKVYDRKLDEYYAMKIEPYNTKARRELSSLQAVTYKEGFLELVDYFKTEFNTLHIVFTLVGTTLHDYIRTFNHKKVDLRTVVLLADQLICRLYTLHSAGYIHRDIKTDNLAMGLGDDKSVLYMLDLGLVKRIKTDQNHHIHMHTGHDLIGNSRYCSLNSHRGYTLSRRDDLESLAYLLICMLKGKLPWSDRKDYHDIYRKKKASATELCQGLEPEFTEFLRYARNLDFKKKPDYDYLRGLFRQIANRHNFKFDGIFSWMDEETKKNAEAAKAIQAAFAAKIMAKNNSCEKKEDQPSNAADHLMDGLDDIKPDENHPVVNNKPDEDHLVDTTQAVVVNDDASNETCPANKDALSSVNTNSRKRKDDVVASEKNKKLKGPQ